MYQFRVIVIPGREKSYLKYKVCCEGRIIAEATNVKYTQMITWEAWPPECGEDGWGACPERWGRGASPSHVPGASGQETPGNLLMCKTAPDWSDQTIKCRTLRGRASLQRLLRLFRGAHGLRASLPVNPGCCTDGWVRLRASLYFQQELANPKPSAFASILTWRLLITSVSPVIVC